MNKVIGLLLLFCFSSSLNAAPVTYRFSGSVDNEFYQSEGTLIFETGVFSYLDWTYDPDTWYTTGSTVSNWRGDAAVNLVMEDFATGTAGLSNASYFTGYSDSPNINLQARNDPDVNGDGRTPTGGPYYIFDIKLYDSTGNSNAHGDSLITLMPNASGHPPSVTLLEIDYSHNVIGSTVWEISSVSIVPIPAAAWLFASGLIGLIGYKRSWMMSREVDA